RRARGPPCRRPAARDGRRRIQPAQSRARVDARRRGVVGGAAGCACGRGRLMFGAGALARLDPELAAAVAAERAREEQFIELIASENYVSPQVLEAQGSVLTNK